MNHLVPLRLKLRGFMFMRMIRDYRKAHKSDDPSRRYIGFYKHWQIMRHLLKKLDAAIKNWEPRG